MALNSASLKADLETLFSNPPAGYSACADAWAQAYRDYAAGARSCQSIAPFAANLDAAKAVLAAALTATFSTSTDPATTAANFASALTAFWLTPPVTFIGGATPGAVTAVAGAAALAAALPAMWLANVAGSVSNTVAAQNHADLFHAFTLTVAAAHVPPSACAAPLA